MNEEPSETTSGIEKAWNSRLGRFVRWFLIVPFAVLVSRIVGFITGPMLLSLLPDMFSEAEWPKYLLDVATYAVCPHAFVVIGAYVAPSLRRSVSVILSILWPCGILYKIKTQGGLTWAWVCLGVAVLSCLVATYECFQQFGSPNKSQKTASALANSD